ncbi:MAG TPA: sulfotransferase domain-containing protein [Polyangium sp.]|nr:sulfotransferase domain-containing protein [Polyangium sp.]
MTTETAPPKGGAPWVDPELQKDVEWRDGDIIVSVPGKSGTTWTMNIVHQLRSGGDGDFKDVYVEVPWLEFVEGPYDTRERRLERFRNMPTSRRRAFKTHASPPMIPYLEPGPNVPDVKYLVVVRNPEEALVSLKPFMEGHSQAFFDFWKFPKQDLVRPSFREFYRDVLQNMPIDLMFFGFLAAWWPLRNKPNVRLYHFSELKNEPGRVIPEIADFLGFTPTKEQWPKILEYSSFEWMKKHQEKFEIQHLLGFPLLDPGAMVRKGAVGAAKEDGMTEEIARDFRAKGEVHIKNPKLLDWFYHGGQRPED